MIASALALAVATASPAVAAAAPVAVTAEAAAPTASEAAEPDVQLDDLPPADPDPTGTATSATAKAEPASSPEDFDIAAPQPFPDPPEGINRVSYAISQPIDRLILRPLAITYQSVLPRPLRDGARNAIANVRTPVVFANDLLQLRPDRALKTLARFLINSAIGVFGLFDIAKRKPFNLARRGNGFGNTLGYYGIGPVAYLYLPVLGPSTLRDTAAQFGDGLIDNRLLDKVIYPNSGRRILRDTPDLGTVGTVITIVDGLDQRAENDAELRSIQEDSIDPYAALRANFLQNRASDIAELKARAGEVPKTEGFSDPLVDPETVTADK